MYLRNQKLIVVGIVFAAIAMLACGDDDGTKPITGEPGFYGTMADSLEVVLNRTVREHAQLNASLEYFTPHIAAILNPEGLLSSSIAAVGCIPDETRGVVYQYNGSEYVGAPNAEPSEDAIFTLYALSPGGTPLLSEPIGEIYYNCSSVESSESFYIQLHTPNRVPIWLLGSPSETGMLIDGRFYSLTNNMAVVVSGSYKAGTPPGSTSLGLDFAFWDQSLTAQPDLGNAAFQQDFMLDGSCQVQTSFHGYRGGRAAWTTAPPPWRFSVKLTGNANGAVTGGFATYSNSDDSISGLSACVQAGSVVGPSFTLPSASCLPDTVLLPVNTKELEAMRRIYDGMYELRGTFDRCLAAITPLIWPGN